MNKVLQCETVFFLQMFQKRMILISVILKCILQALISSILAQLQIFAVQCVSYQHVYSIWNLLIRELVTADTFEKILSFQRF